MWVKTYENNVKEFIETFFTCESVGVAHYTYYNNFSILKEQYFYIRVDLCIHFFKKYKQIAVLFYGLKIHSKWSIFSPSRKNKIKLFEWIIKVILFFEVAFRRNFSLKIWKLNGEIEWEESDKKCQQHFWLRFILFTQ